VIILVKILTNDFFGDFFERVANSAKRNNFIYILKRYDKNKRPKFFKVKKKTLVYITVKIIPFCLRLN